MDKTNKGYQLKVAALASSHLPIFERITRLNDDEIEVLAEVLDFALQGLEKGRSGYGPLMIDLDKRDFAKEANEEMRDGGIYLAIDKIQKERTK